LDALQRVHLEIADIDAIFPHEIADVGREQRIKGRLQADGILRDPLLVGAMPNANGYVLLDGTNRHGALAALGLSRALVQVLDYTDSHAVQLQTWCHATAFDVQQIADRAESISDLEVHQAPPLETAALLSDMHTLAIVLGRKARYVLRRNLDAATTRAEQLRQVVDLYEHVMTRVDCDPEDVEERAGLLGGPEAGEQTLVAFPCFSRSQVRTMAMEGTRIPAGITRHIVLRGRALRVNVPLSLLQSDRSIEQARAGLEQHVRGLQPRHYQEPTILFDS